jgi:hypothetical protein
MVDCNLSRVSNFAGARPNIHSPDFGGRAFRKREKKHQTHRHCSRLPIAKRKEIYMAAPMGHAWKLAATPSSRFAGFSTFHAVSGVGLPSCTSAPGDNKEAP